MCESGLGVQQAQVSDHKVGTDEVSTLLVVKNRLNGQVGDSPFIMISYNCHRRYYDPHPLLLSVRSMCTRLRLSHPNVLARPLLASEITLHCPKRFV